MFLTAQNVGKTDQQETTDRVWGSGTFLTGEEALKIGRQGTFLAVQWLGLHASTAGSPGSIPGRGTKIPQVAWAKKKIFF